MTSVQPTLDGAEPGPRPSRERCDDFETWLAAVRPAYQAAAATGQPFTTYSVADANRLPEPPNSQAHWGRLMTLLREEGWVRRHGWTTSDRPTTHHSGVRVWVGTRAARDGRVA